MADADLRTPTHNGDLMVAALKRHRDKPVMHLGDTTLTGGETAQRISQYVQAFEALDAGTGTAELPSTRTATRRFIPVIRVQGMVRAAPATSSTVGPSPQSTTRSPALAPGTSVRSIVSISMETRPTTGARQSRTPTGVPAPTCQG